MVQITMLATYWQSSNQMQWLATREQLSCCMRHLSLTYLHTCIYVYTSTNVDIYKNIQLYDTFKSCLCSCNLKFAHTRINLFMCVSVLWISYFCICYEILLSIKDQQHEQQQFCYNNTTECILSQHTYMNTFVHSP